ncbi:hypothetical protein, partial [Desulfurivibrio sp. C05AmB]|uniref:hypothetical protein n=1 Tax=Desulfurivibrio sp. C05AmB TaxID=3374371 RepID=UPI00376EBEAC
MTRRPRTQLPVRLLLIILILAGWAATALAAGPTILHPRGIIEGHYIVVLKTEAGEPAAAAAMLGRVHGFEPGFVYGHA